MPAPVMAHEDVLINPDAEFHRKGEKPGGFE
jgi:hypothetical protein